MLQRKQTVFLLLLASRLVHSGEHAANVADGKPLGKHARWRARLFGMAFVRRAVAVVPNNNSGYLCLSQPHFPESPMPLVRNRIFQSRLCLLSMLLMLAWYAAYAVFGYAVPRVENAAFTPSLAAAFPLVNVILLLMARHGILADEALVRAADRIR